MFVASTSYVVAQGTTTTSRQLAPKTVLHAEAALILCGYGDTLGRFEVFAEHLVKSELNAKYGENITIVHLERKLAFLEYLKNTNFEPKIKEFHIFSHAYGAALSLGYHNIESNSIDRQVPEKLDDRAYYTALKNEIGSLFVDDLLEISDPTPYRRSLMSKSFIKIWGCNSGITGHPFNAGYWSVFNYKHYPKPSIAQTMADFFNVNVWGATSGSHVEIFWKGQWLRSDHFKKQLKPDPAGFKSGKNSQRLHPGNGDYQEYTPVVGKVPIE